MPDLVLVSLIIIFILLTLASLVLMVCESIAMLRLKGRLFNVGWIVVRFWESTEFKKTDFKSDAIISINRNLFRFIDPATCYFIQGFYLVPAFSPVCIKCKLEIRKDGVMVTGRLSLSTFLVYVFLGSMLALGVLMGVALDNHRYPNWAVMFVCILAVAGGQLVFFAWGKKRLLDVYKSLTEYL